MIDTCKPIVYMTESVSRALRMAQDSATPSIKIYGNHFFVKNKFGLKALRVNFSLTKESFWFETSLPKFLQGHNVFGSNDLVTLCLDVIALIYEHLGVVFSDKEAQEIRDARIRLARIDLTCSYMLESAAMVDQVLELIYEQFRAEGKAWSAYGQDSVESTYNQQTSTRVTDKFYNKAKELAKQGRGLPTAVINRQRIQRIVDKLLRFEVTYRQKELAELGLDYADCWDTQRVKAELEIRLQNYKLQGVLRPKLAAAELRGLGDNYRTFYRLWADGADLAKHRKYRTLLRARQHLLEHHQIDIFRRTASGCPIPLNELLDPSRALYAAPRWGLVA